MKLKEYRQTIMELGDNTYSTYWADLGDGDKNAIFNTDSGRKIDVSFSELSNKSIDVAFSVDGSYTRFEKATNQEQYRLMGTVVKAISDYVTEHNPWMLTFSASRHYSTDGNERNSRARVYEAYIKRLAKKNNYAYTKQSSGSTINFVIYKNEPINELMVQVDTQVKNLNNDLDDWRAERYIKQAITGIIGHEQLYDIDWVNSSTYSSGIAKQEDGTVTFQWSSHVYLKPDYPTGAYEIFPTAYFQLVNGNVHIFKYKLLIQYRKGKPDDRQAIVHKTQQPSEYNTLTDITKHAYDLVVADIVKQTKLEQITQKQDPNSL